MDAKRDAGESFALAMIWEDVDPKLLEPALASIEPALARPDPLEAIVRDQVLARIGAVRKSQPARPAWFRQPQVWTRRAAAVVLVIAALWLVSLPFRQTGGRASATTAATTAAATTAAGSTTAGTTAAATGATSAAATTTAAAGATGATTAATTGATTAATSASTTQASITWPAPLTNLLGFDMGQARAARLLRYDSNGMVERSVTLAGSPALGSLVELLGRARLDQPSSGAVQPLTGQYEIVFELDPAAGAPGGEEQRLRLTYQEEQNRVMVSGTFLDRLDIQAPDGLQQVNPGLTLFEIRNQLDSLLA